jgi:5-methylcytosine-specific restriction endonuclease McrA
MPNGLNNKSISGWVRQARHRAKKHNIFSDLEIADVLEILEAADNQCAYCQALADTLDSPFPLKDGGPHVPANVVPCCKKCKMTKGTNDVVWLYTNGRLAEAKYLSLIQELLRRRGGERIKDHVRRATGLTDKE